MHQMEQKPHLGGTWAGGDPNSWAPEVWEKIIKDKRIRSVVDIGCGEGYSTEFFHKAGLYTVGIEGGDNAYKVCVAKGLKMVQHDYYEGKPQVGPVDGSYVFDLGWCCEFVEHLEEKYIPNFLDTFKMCRYLAVTHAFPGQPGYHHVNCQEASYWISKIEAIGFKLELPYSEQLRALTPALHVNRSLLFFSRS